MQDDEYDLSDNEDESASPTPTTSSLKDEDEVARTLAMSKVSGSDLESEHSEWFKVEADDLKIPRKVDDSETEEDNDSDNQDLNEPEAVEEDNDDEWLSIPRENQAEIHASVPSSSMTGTQSFDGFDVVQAPQFRAASVGYCPSASSTNV